MTTIRISSACRWLGVSASTICTWKRCGLISDPGRGKVVQEEAEAMVKSKQRNPEDDLGEPTVHHKRKESKPVGIEQALRPAIRIHNGQTIYLHNQ